MKHFLLAISALAACATIAEAAGTSAPASSTLNKPLIAQTQNGGTGNASKVNRNPRNANSSGSSTAKDSVKAPNLRPQPDTRTANQKTLDSNMRNADEASKREAARIDAEAMRDKRHDNRVKVSKDTSIGPSTDPPGANIRTTTK